MIQTTKKLRTPLPTHRAPTTPGEFIAEEFLKPLGKTQEELATAMRVSRQRVNEIINGRREVTPDTALRLERVLGPSAEFWLDMQLRVDLYKAQTTRNSEIRRLKFLSPQLARVATF